MTPERDSRVDVEVQRLASREFTVAGRASRSITRFFIRTCRIIVGMLILALALSAADKALDVLNTPFAAQSFGNILLGLLCGLGAFWGIALAWGSAFGSGPTPHEVEMSRRQQAMELVAGQDLRTAERQRGHRQNEAVVSFARATGRRIGRLFQRE